MSIEADLRAFLLADATIAGLVTQRIHPLVLPQGSTLPAVSYSTISAIGDHTMQGASGLRTPRIQIDAWATLFDDAQALASAIRARLDGFSGAMGDTTVQGAFLNNRRDGHESDVKAFRISQDFIIWHRT